MGVGKVHCAARNGDSDQNLRLVDPGFRGIAIASIRMGDPVTDYAQLVVSGYDVGCTSPFTTQFLNARYSMLPWNLDLGPSPGLSVSYPFA